MIDDKVYLAAGRRSTAKIGQVLDLIEPAVDVYDFNTDRWTTLSESNEVEVSNTETASWEIFLPLKTGRHGTGAVHINGKIYIVAGSGNRGGGPELNSIEVLR